jgi:hypothetical protein
MQRLNAIKDENKKANEAALRAWILTKSPAEIEKANLARQKLRKTFKVPSRTPLPDERIPKRPGSPFSIYVQESGVLRSRDDRKVVSDALLRVAAQWKGMSAAQKKVRREQRSLLTPRDHELIRRLAFQRSIRGKG